MEENASLTSCSTLKDETETELQLNLVPIKSLSSLC